MCGMILARSCEGRLGLGFAGLLSDAGCSFTHSVMALTDNRQIIDGGAQLAGSTAALFAFARSLLCVRNRADEFTEQAVRSVKARYFLRAATGFGQRIVDVGKTLPVCPVAKAGSTRPLP